MELKKELQLDLDPPDPSSSLPSAKRLKLDSNSLLSNDPHPHASSIFTPVPSTNPTHSHGSTLLISPSAHPVLTSTQQAPPTAEDLEDPLDESSLRITYRASEDQIKDFIENICTEDQRERYYAFRRIRFHHPSIRKLSTAVTGTTAPKSLPLVISALSRTYISQIIDHARKAMQDHGVDPKSPMSPFYLQEGYRRYHTTCRGNKNKLK
ncbi:hypothetical protein HMI54_005033 [Coelomomyces lativittatus]|nr:hypothetical protein HMI55_005311 [Coelomomyces lativittatus]KAJ1502005.1 hypothetical protein HMI56_002918 [Coelomomyces lativittatus]KAJ1506497.1 hypothetical protein HMI54_005033 [Coelomomyces lativittatus]